MEAGEIKEQRDKSQMKDNGGTEGWSVRRSVREALENGKTFTGNNIAYQDLL